ncbi:MAG: aminomethyl-transferring glycine dehydrogenase subunit GcvPA [Candidatus Sumerlaeia bacterium]|nr:aminomethyl-transferring glycine dehydrogenase subunit GcvPA [Candidatus Sumerlaeia bacterium]
MVYTPHTPAEIQSMLQTIGAAAIEELFEAIPRTDCQADFSTLPAGKAEMDVWAECRRLAGLNRGVHRLRSFLGAGAYEHFIPAVVDHLLRRGEFFTAYTPYQAEASQGTLQAIYEYQSMICALTALEVANASLYDGASALAEAVVMAVRHTNRTCVALTTGLHPALRQVVQTYTRYLGVQFIELPFANGATDAAALDRIGLPGDLAAAIVQHPNSLGCLEPAEAIANWAHRRGGLCIGAVNPLSLGVLQPPGKWGADIAVGDGQPMGIPLSFGGPYVGFMALRKVLARRMPGRLVGCTLDRKGEKGLVLTLQTREQHIRREKATSNICTNQALCALAVTIYLALVGKTGFQKVAVLNLERSHYLAEKAAAVRGVRPAWSAPFFNEFVLELPCKAESVVRAMKEKGIVAGWPLARWSERWPKNLLLLCATETKSKADCDAYVEALAGVLPR